MDSKTFYMLAADTILITHVAFVAFVISGLLLTFIGKFCKWQWIRNPWFRLAHLATIAIVVCQAWIGVICPLTDWEMALREKAGAVTYSGSFIAHWLHNLLYFQAPPWVFTACYTAFGLLVVTSWIWIRPRPFSRPN